MAAAAAAAASGVTDAITATFDAILFVCYVPLWSLPDW